MSTHTRFPNSMVDRITPVTTPDVIAGLKDEFDVEDQWPVVAEPFTSWVLEDDFSDGRPPLEDVDVLMVDDVTPYELMKLRLLNASHQSLCYFAYLAGYRLVHDAAGDPLFAEFLMRYMDTEATPTLLPVPGHRPARLQAHADRAVRQPRSARHHRPAVLRLVGPHPEVAAAGRSARTWPPQARSGCRRRRWPAGRATPRASTSRASRSRSQDQLADTLVPLAQSQRENPTAFIENTAVFGDLASHARFVEAYLWALDSLHRDGARATALERTSETEDERE